MPDQFAGRAIDIDAFQSVEFFPREVEDVRAAHHVNVDAFAIEMPLKTDLLSRLPRAKLRFFGGDSRINSRYLAFGRSTRTSRNSLGPFSKRRFRLAFSPAGASIAKLSIAFDARSSRAARCRAEGSDLVLTARPISTSLRNASDRVVLFAPAQVSTSAISAGGMRAATCGSFPVAGRPRLFLGATLIDFFMI